MRILLDTQCWLWMNASPERFRPATRDLIETDATELLFSAASAWEIAVKYSLKRLQLPMSPADYVESRLRQTRATPLPISTITRSGRANCPRGIATRSTGCWWLRRSSNTCRF